jgi:hypothetical protein
VRLDQPGQAPLDVQLHLDGFSAVCEGLEQVGRMANQGNRMERCNARGHSSPAGHQQQQQQQQQQRMMTG